MTTFIKFIYHFSEVCRCLTDVSDNFIANDYFSSTTNIYGKELSRVITADTHQD